MKTPVAVVAAMVLAVVTSAPANAAGQDARPMSELDRSSDREPDRDWFLELDAWLAAVDRHQPGTADSAAQTVAPWSMKRLTAMLGDLVELRKRMAIYATRKNAEIRIRLRRLAPDDICLLFRITDEERLASDVNRIIRRGAVLHADIAVFARDLPIRVGSREVMVKMSDGRQTSTAPGTEHWTFGRALLGALQPGQAGDRFARAWYAATSAYMQNERMVTLADDHLAHARNVLNDDAEILFRGACALETLASRRTQTEMRSLVPPPGYRFEVPSSQGREGEAIQLFARVLALEPRNVEARVRMSRLVGQHGRHEEAAAELRRALDADLDDRLRYFAWLFLGDEELALDHRTEASTAYERAARLFPNAPSPVVALARLAREQGDRAATGDAMRRWWALPRDSPDPWRDFYFMHGAEFDALLQEVYHLAGEAQR